MRSALLIIARILGCEHYKDIDWSKIEYKHTAYIRGQLIANGYAPATINKKIACLKGVLKESWKLGVMSLDQYHRASDLNNVKGNSPKLGRIISIEEQKALAKICLNHSNKSIGMRDFAILNVARLGLRRIEIARLNLSDYEEDKLNIFGKGNKHRVIPLPVWAINSIEKWIELRGNFKGAIFTHVHKGRKIIPKRMSAYTIGQRIKNISIQAGINDIASHCFRFTFVTELLTQGLDLASVQKAVGHSSPLTTAKYDLRNQNELKQTMNKFEDIG